MAAKKSNENELNRQNQSEGTPRPFSNQAGREETRNISPDREHLSQAWNAESGEETGDESDETDDEPSDDESSSDVTSEE